jgi:hypothetical protein
MRSCDVYQLTHTAGVTRLSDGAFIPADAGNRDWMAYQAWLVAGNVPSPAPAAPSAPIVVSAASLRRALAAKGWLVDVRGAVAGADPLTQELWAAASVFPIDDPMVGAVAAAIGKTPDDVLAVFQLAETYV